MTTEQTTTKADSTAPLNGTAQVALLRESEDYTEQSENGGITGVIDGIHGIAKTLYGPMFEDINSDEAQLMTYALVQLTGRLYESAHNVSDDTRHKVERALAAPDARAEALVKRLKATEYELYINAADNSYALGTGYEGRIYAFTPSIDEIEEWLARKVAQPTEPSGPRPAA